MPQNSSFTADNNYGTAPLVVQYTDTSGPAVPSQWEWNFGDGTISTEQNPLHVFSSSGLYTITLRTFVVDTWYTSDPYGVYAQAWVSAPTQASFTLSVLDPVAYVVGFTDTSGPIVPTSWSWDFGDGSPISTDPSPTHTYATSGTYTIRLTTVTDTLVTISDPQSVVFPTNIVSFAANVDDNLVTFTDTSDLLGTSWLWDFGDGSTSTEHNPVYTYSTSGQYNVTLSVYNAYGGHTTSPPATIYTSSYDYVNIGSRINDGFTSVSGIFISDLSLSLGTPTAWLWDFGDNTTSIEKNPAHTYLTYGSYTQRLTISVGQVSYKSQPYIVAWPVGTMSFTHTLSGSTATFTVTAYTYPYDEWLWDFGDGTTSAEQNPVHTYTSAGTFTVNLSARATSLSTPWFDATPQNVFVVSQTKVGQKVKVQGSSISYTTTDITRGLDFNVAGTINVWGINSPIDGIIASPDATLLTSKRLDITTGTHSTLNIYENATGGSLYLNNAQWPSGNIQPVPGMFLGVSALNKLKYLPFILGNALSDTLTAADLNALYPTAQPGQQVLGPTVIYYSGGAGQWRTSSTVTSVGISAPASQITISGSPITTSGNIAIDLTPTAVNPGSYTNANIIVDAYGRITSATDGASIPQSLKVVAYTAPDTSANQVVDTLNITLYRAVTYNMTITSGSSYQFTQLTILQDGTTAYLGQSGTISSSPVAVSFTADIVSGFLRLLSTPPAAGTIYNAVATLVAA